LGLKIRVAQIEDDHFIVLLEEFGHFIEQAFVYLLLIQIQLVCQLIELAAVYRVVVV
jgi:hypothetical protein